MNFDIPKLISGKHFFSQVITVIGGIFVLVGIWTTILYVQTEPYYKFNSEEYLNLLQKIETELERYKTKVEAITSGLDTINQVQAAKIDELMRQPESYLFTVTLDSNVKSSIYTFKYSDFIYYNKNYRNKNFGDKIPIYEVISVTPSFLSSEQQLALQRMNDSLYKSNVDIVESFHRIVPYARKSIEPLVKKFTVYVNKKTTFGQFAVWFLLPGLILFLIGLSNWITGVKAEKREEKRLAAIKQFEESDKKEIRPSWIMAQETLKEYFDRNLFQIRLIFVVSVVIMTAGFLLIAVGVIIAYEHPNMSLIQNVAVASGLITELIGATFIVIYNSTIRQAITYTDSLERINSVGMSVTILDSMKDTITNKDELNKAKIEVAKLLLTLDKKSTDTTTTQS